MSRVFGEMPRPRMLVVTDGFSGMDFSSLRKLAPTVREVTAAELHDGINQVEWDVAVLWDCNANISSHVAVIQFGGSETSSLGTHTVHRGYSITTGFCTQKSPSVSYRSAAALEVEVTNLLAGLANLLVEAGRAHVMDVTDRDSRERLIQPFLVNADGLPVAGVYKRESPGREWWWLPAETPDVHGWVRAALARWGKLEPDVFGSQSTDWTADERWQTAPEREAADRLVALEAAREEAAARYAAEIRELRSALDAAASAATERERRLLTAQGPELVEEVGAALADLGFDVQDVDREIATKGDLLEDLRVREFGDSEWVALVEVRGYAAGAKLNDLLRIGRFAARFAATEGRMPPACWYVVNHFIRNDPGTRDHALASNPSEVKTFAEGGGMVLDTRDLFRLREMVRRGSTTAEEARIALKRTGRFVL